MENVAKPAIVSAEKWQQTREDLLKAGKKATRALDALAARRRCLPDRGRILLAMERPAARWLA